jgi:hypothetical protein
MGEPEAAQIEAHRLGGAIEKYNRSKEQFDVFRTELGEFLDQEPKPHFSRGEFDSDTWEWVERFQIRKKLPLRLGVILGDCVHNLRSALDHVICQTTLLDGGTMEDCARTQFPIVVESEARFEELANRQIKGLSPEHRTLVKLVQPYRAGDGASRHPLAVLADLSNTDKHRVINTAYSVIESDSGAVLDRLVESYQGGDEPSPVRAWWMLSRGMRLEHETPWFRIEFHRHVPGPMKVEMGGNLSLGVGIGEIGLDSRDFPKVAELVYSIIERFMREFPETAYHD